MGGMAEACARWITVIAQLSSESGVVATKARLLSGEIAMAAPAGASLLSVTLVELLRAVEIMSTVLSLLATTATLPSRATATASGDLPVGMASPSGRKLSASNKSNEP